MKINYQKILDDTLKQIQAKNQKPTLLLHSCCAPCSSYVLEYLCKYFDITVFYYNPNISPEEEYLKRVDEQSSFIHNLQKDCGYHIKFIEGLYKPKEFYNIVKGLEKEPEGSIRCFKCYRLRLEKTAKLAKEKGYDYFTTTLSISPHKNAQKINEIGKELSDIYNVSYLYSDFKKKNGFKRSIELSQKYNLYRQNYCGCIYSKINR